MVASTSAPAPKITCSCPKISIAEPEKEGSDLIFKTNIDGLFSNQLSFIWTVIGGNVVSQDKRTIRINPGNVAVGGSVSVIVNGLEPEMQLPKSGAEDVLIGDAGTNDLHHRPWPACVCGFSCSSEKTQY